MNRLLVDDSHRNSSLKTKIDITKSVVCFSYDSALWIFDSRNVFSNNVSF